MTPTAAFARFLACVVCIACLACFGAQTSPTTQVVEPPAELQESAREGDDDETDAAPHVDPGSERRAPPSSWTHRLLEHDSGQHVLADTFAVVRARFDDAPPLRRFANIPRHGSQACTARLLLASAPPRGPTILG